MRIALACLIVACTTAQPRATISNTRAPRADDRLALVHGTVVDYRRRRVGGIAVTSNGVRVRTDANGRFTARVLRGAWLTAQTDDTSGTVVVGDAAEQDVVITLIQMLE